MVETWPGLEEDARQIAKELAAVVDDANSVNRVASITGVVNHTLAELDSPVSVIPRNQLPENALEIREQALSYTARSSKRLTVRERLEKAVEQATVIGMGLEEIDELRRDIIRGAASKLRNSPTVIISRL